MHSIVRHAESTLRQWRRAEGPVAGVLDQLHDTLGRALVRATRSARSMLRSSRSASTHAVIAGAVTASASIVESSMGGVAAPVASLAADLATIGIAVHAVSSLRRRSRVALPTHVLFERSVRRVMSLRSERAGRWVMAYSALRSGTFRIDRAMAREWARRALIPASVSAAAGMLPGVGPMFNGVAQVGAIVRNYAFVQAIEIEAARLVAAECARVPTPQPAIIDAMWSEIALAA